MRRRDFIAAVAVPIAVISAHSLPALASGDAIRKDYPQTTFDLYEWVNRQLEKMYTFTVDGEPEIRRGMQLYSFWVRQNPSHFDARGETALCEAAAKRLEQDMEGKTKVFWRRIPELTKSRDLAADQVKLKLRFRVAFL